MLLKFVNNKIVIIFRHSLQLLTLKINKGIELIPYFINFPKSSSLAFVNLLLII